MMEWIIAIGMIGLLICAIDILIGEPDRTTTDATEPDLEDEQRREMYTGENT